MTKELLQQALYALIDSLDLVAGAHAEAVELYSTYTSPQARIVGLKREVYAHESAIKALEAAIAQPEHLGVVPQTTHVSIALDAIETIAHPIQQAIYDALKLAGNRLQRIALELPHAQRVECHEWAHEAFEAIAQPVFHLRQYGDVTAAQLDEAAAQPEQLITDALDAARYRWLRNHENGTCVVNGELLAGEKLDLAVDNLTKETK